MAAHSNETTRPETQPDFRSVHSLGLPGLLESLGITLLVSTYQAGKLMAIRGVDGRISTLLRSFERPMGLAVDDGHRFALSTRSHVWFFRNAPDIATQLAPAGKIDACFLPRTSVVTGDIRAHEIGWVGDELCIVNTLFSCLCTLDPAFSFVPRWRPPFVTAVTAEDRCHLNGLAVVDGQARYVTALGETDTPEGWRPNKATGGVLVDVPSGAVVCRGISMVHSPRVYGGHVCVLESGTGRLQIVDVTTGRRDTVVEVPGFARGLAFHGPYAFVGLSTIRETAVFGGLPIAERVPQLRCGIWVIDMRTGQSVEFMQFEAGVAEIFAIEILEGIRFPEIIGFQEDSIHGTFVVPRSTPNMTGLA